MGAVWGESDVGRRCGPRDDHVYVSLRFLSQHGCSSLLKSWRLVRGDAANHGILDASNIVKALQKVISGEAGLEEVIGEYDVEVKARCRPSVLGSRQACFDALMIDRPVDGSPLLEVGTGPLDKTRRWNPQE